MSLIRKTDIKNHVSTRTGASLLPFRNLSQPDATGYSGEDAADTTVRPAGPDAGSVSAVSPLSTEIPVNRQGARTPAKPKS
jgi:hypothetical protein